MILSNTVQLVSLPNRLLHGLLHIFKVQKII